MFTSPKKTIKRRKSESDVRKMTRGEGLTNWLIKKMPIEMHVPGYHYCGPGTKLRERLARGDPGVNELDRACKEHDIAYSKYKNISDRNIADKILAEKAWQRAKAPDFSLSERAASLAITGIMNTKASLGMGLGSKISSFFNHKQFKRGGCNSIGRSCSKKRGKGLPNMTKKTASRTNKKKKTKKINVKAIFREARARANEAIHKRGPRTIDTAARVAKKAAVAAVKRINKKQPISPQQVENGLRVIPVPKRGAALPLIPIFAGLSALGALLGGSASIANAATAANNAKKNFSEAQRHNQTMEAIALGRNAHTGSGLYLRPYKNGLGLYLAPSPQQQQQQEQQQPKNF